ncbi:MAG: FAD-binding protein [Caldilineaceae bacterium]
MTITVPPIQTLKTQFQLHQFVLDPIELITYEVDAGFDRGRPDGAFFPRMSKKSARSCVGQTTPRHRWSPQRGTGLSGGAVAEHGGVIIEFARMNQLLDFDPVGRSGVVQPGLVNLHLDGIVRKAGFYYPPDPASQRSSVLGGNIGENSGGPHCFKYGVTTNYVTGLEVVLADGEIIQFGGPALDYPEYDFCGALVGSEGTIGHIYKSLRPFYSRPARGAHDDGRLSHVGGCGQRGLRGDRRWTDAGNAGDDGPKDYGHHRRILECRVAG